jgi:hypothetical protein
MYYLARRLETSWMALFTLCGALEAEVSNDLLRLLHLRFAAQNPGL